MGFYCKGKFVSDEEFGDKTVIKVKEKVSGEELALKKWRADSVGAKNEIRAWKKLYGDEVSCVWEENGELFLARKWIEGESLYEYVRARLRLAEREALDIFIKICEALNAFYRASGEVYCDLKPENIIMTGENVRLVDFENIQKENVNDTEGNVMSLSNTIYFASKDYSAPEMYHGEVSKSADVYSLGMILCFMLFGTASPSEGFSSPHIESLYEKCTAHRREKRFNSATEAAEACFAALAGLLERKNDVAEGFSPVLQVENLNVNAERINYGVNNKRLLTRENTVSAEDKIVVFPKNPVGYRRIIVYVPENIAFATEIAFMFSKLYEMQTAVFDVSDYVSDSLRFYLPVETEEAMLPCEFDRGGMEVADCAENFGGIAEIRRLLTATKSAWQERGLLSRCCESGNLYVSSCDVFKEIELNLENMRDFTLWCYSNFDVTVLCDRNGNGRDKRAAIMKYSDFVIVPVETDVDEIEYKKRYFLNFMEENFVPLSKLRFVGWNYSEEESADHEAVVLTLGEHIYLGTVGKDRNRRKVKNINGRFYCREAAPWLKAQYGHIIKNLMFNEEKIA